MKNSHNSNNGSCMMSLNDEESVDVSGLAINMHLLTFVVETFHALDLLMPLPSFAAAQSLVKQNYDRNRKVIVVRDGHPSLYFYQILPFHSNFMVKSNPTIRTNYSPFLLLEGETALCPLHSSTAWARKAFVGWDEEGAAATVQVAMLNELGYMSPGNLGSRS